MLQVPKVKKALTGLVSAKRIKRVVAGVILAAGLIVGGAAMPTDSDAAISIQQNGTNEVQSSQIGALLLTSPTAGLTRTAWHESHASHGSHGSHESHASHYSSRY
jgi:hypothetical protein